MLEPFEQILFNLILAIVLLVVFYSIYLFLPIFASFKYAFNFIETLNI